MIDLSRHNSTIFKDSMELTMLPPSSKLYQMWVIWKEYIDFFVIGNDHIKKMLFFNMLGVILTYKDWGYYKEDTKVTTRINYFSFQRSRTGKGVAMKAKHRLLDYLGIPSRYTMKDHISSAIGTSKYNDKTGKVDRRYGYCKHLYDYNWDEGSILLKPGNNMDDATDNFQGIMDEPGWVSKGMAWEGIEYKTNVSLAAGSIMFKEFNHALMSKGFFQRMAITYKRFTESEKQELRRYVPLLKNRYNPDRITKLKERFKELFDELPNGTDKVIKFDVKDNSKFVKIYDEIYYNLIDKQFVGQTQDVLESFNDTLHILIDKISAQKAVIEGRDTVVYEDYCTSLPIIKLHLSSILDLFDYVEANESSVVDKREGTIIGIIQKMPPNTPILKKDVLERLDYMKKLGKWDIGRNKTLMLINSMIDKGILGVEVREGVKTLKIIQ